jgi:hypothetical protein
MKREDLSEGTIIICGTGFNEYGIIKKLRVCDCLVEWCMNGDDQYKYEPIHGYGFLERECHIDIKKSRNRVIEDLLK